MMASGVEESHFIYVVTFRGPFGFIKPWTAVRDGVTYSQAFLTPSIVEGLRQKLEVSSIVRHRVRHSGLNLQQERTQSAGWKKGVGMTRPRSIITRGVMVEPVLLLALETTADAQKAASQHVCLCRNEDVLLPADIRGMTMDEFDRLPGVELRFEQGPDSFLVGFNRFADAAPMYGHLTIVDSEGGGEDSE